MMKNLLLTTLGVIWIMTMQAQPRPFEPDPAFTPSLEFMQKKWTGDYDGLEPNSRMIMSLHRELILQKDLTYTNEVKGKIKDQSEEVVLQYESGTYQIDADTKSVKYSVDADSTLDMNILLKGEEPVYTVNHYKTDGKTMSRTEVLQFTRSENDDSRQWISFDPQLMSPVDSRQKAVYAMTGEDIPAGISILIHETADKRKDVYDLSGRKSTIDRRAIYVINKKKILVKRNCQ